MPRQVNSGVRSACAPPPDADPGGAAHFWPKIETKWCSVVPWPDFTAATAASRPPSGSMVHPSSKSSPKRLAMDRRWLWETRDHRSQKSRESRKSVSASSSRLRSAHNARSAPRTTHKTTHKTTLKRAVRTSSRRPLSSRTRRAARSCERRFGVMHNLSPHRQRVESRENAGERQSGQCENRSAQRDDDRFRRRVVCRVRFCLVR